MGVVIDHDSTGYSVDPRVLSEDDKGVDIMSEFNDKYKDLEGKVNDKATEVGTKFGVDKELVIAIAVVAILVLVAKIFN